MQHWRDEFEKILIEPNIEEKLSKIYVDDNRCIIERIKRGWRYEPSEKKFVYREKWEKEDKDRDDDDRVAEEVLNINH